MIERDGVRRADGGEQVAVKGAVGYEGVRQVLSGVGDIIKETQARQRDAASTYLSEREAEPLHTDHPEALWAAWWCQVQAEQDGVSVRADGQAVLAVMGERPKGPSGGPVACAATVAAPSS